jgi:hypothetical protein
VHLAETRPRGQRHGVQVVDHHLAPPRLRVLAFLVGTQRGRRHLAQLVGDRRGAALGRVAVLFDLGGQRAAAGRRLPRADRPVQLLQRRLREALRVDRGIALGRLRVQQVAVLDEEQCVHQQRRDLLETLVHAFGHARLRQGAGAAVAHRQAGLVLLAVGAVEAVFVQLDQPRRHAGLLRHLVAAGLQALDELRQLAVAEPRIVGPGMRKADGVAGAGLHAEACVAPQVAPKGRLQPRSPELVHGDGDERGHRGEPRTEPEDRPEPCHDLPRCEPVPWVLQPG